MARPKGKATALETLMKEYEERKPLTVDKAKLADLKVAYETALQKVQKAERALEAAYTAASAAAGNLVLTAGRSRLQFSDGSIQRPACHGDRVYYRTEEDGEVL